MDIKLGFLRPRDHQFLWSFQETRQREAFGCLQRQRDLKRQRILDDIREVEEELCRLTRAEQMRRGSSSTSTMREFDRRREDLLKLLAKLQEQKDLRETELQNRLVSRVRRHSP